jgi:hypothetical protein
MITLRVNYKSIMTLTRLALSIACLLVLASATARAQGPCTPVSITPPTDPALLVFEAEGKITSYDRTNRTITVNGMTFAIPSTVLVETRDLDLTGNITFEDLTSPTLEAQRSIIGGTVIAAGDIVFTQSGTGYCMSFRATRVFVEFAENGLVGLLSNVDPATNSFRVNGALVRMNTDPRFPSSIVDLGGSAMTINDLVGQEGTDISAGGYYDATQGVLFGTLIETETVKTVPGGDGVAITRAEWRTGNREMRVEGANARSSSTGQFAASVDVYTGGMNSTGTDCVGTRVGSATVSSVDGSWSFRQRLTIQTPTQVCAKSPLGGVAARATEITN